MLLVRMPLHGAVKSPDSQNALTCIFLTFSFVETPTPPTLPEPNSFRCLIAASQSASSLPLVSPTALETSQ